MSVFILRRLLQSVLVMVAMAVLVFFGVHLVGDPVYMFITPDMDQADIEQVTRALGLDRPIWEQFWIFLTNAVTGNLGKSFVFGEPALGLIIERMPATLELAFAALLMAVVIGIPLGLYAGLYPDSAASKLARRCMRIVDSDRCLYALDRWARGELCAECAEPPSPSTTTRRLPRVSVGSLSPLACTPKSSLILIERPPPSDVEVLEL